MTTLAYASIGDWPLTPRRYDTCNCACHICMAGSCCQFSSGTTYPSTIVTTTTAPYIAHEHRWQAVGLRKGHVIQSCECGEVRRVEVP